MCIAVFETRWMCWTIGEMKLRRIHKLLAAVTCLLMYTMYRVSNSSGEESRTGRGHDAENMNPVQQNKEPIRTSKPAVKKQNFVQVNNQLPGKIVNSEKIVNPVKIRTNVSGSAEHIRQAILDINSKEEIRNLARFPSRSDSSVVILVMVHKRLEYLQYLINSLRKVRGIEDALLIFSHDYYSEEMNALVRTVDFCQTMQIFYPYLLQIYEKEFPGEDPDDCPRNMKKDEARRKKCNNWEHPDKYGHYREVRFVMTKHHWFWKLQHVFGGLGVTKNHNGLVLLVEEDHYVTPDSYYMLKKMYELKSSKCPECDILTLGTYEKSRRYKDRGNTVDALQWYSSKHNMGMALDRSTWQRLQPCVETFCKYDDYNWDWTLQLVSLTCLKPSLTVMVPKAPRIFHIGECGIHHKKGSCNAAELIKQIDIVVASSGEYLFPEILTMTPLTRGQYRKMPRPNGGWGDVRDHALCMAYGRAGQAVKANVML